MSPFSRFRAASNSSGQGNSDSSLSRATDAYERRASDADAALRDKQAIERPTENAVEKVTNTVP